MLLAEKHLKFLKLNCNSSDFQSYTVLLLVCSLFIPCIFFLEIFWCSQNTFHCRLYNVYLCMWQIKLILYYCKKVFLLKSTVDVSETKYIYLVFVFKKFWFNCILSFWHIKMNECLPPKDTDLKYTPDIENSTDISVYCQVHHIKNSWIFCKNTHSLSWLKGLFQSSHPSPQLWFWPRLLWISRDPFSCHISSHHSLPVPYVSAANVLLSVTLASHSSLSYLETEEYSTWDACIQQRLSILRSGHK